MCSPFSVCNGKIDCNANLGGTCDTYFLSFCVCVVLYRAWTSGSHTCWVNVLPLSHTLSLHFRLRIKLVASYINFINLTTHLYAVLQLGIFFKSFSKNSRSPPFYLISLLESVGSWVIFDYSSTCNHSQSTVTPKPPVSSLCSLSCQDRLQY